MTDEQISRNCPSMRKYPKGRTATGTIPKVGRTVACDPSLKGKSVYIGNGIGYRICEDTGGAIKGDRVDVFVKTYAEGVDFGTQLVPFTIL